MPPAMQTLFVDQVFFTDWRYGSIHTVNKYDGSGSVTLRIDVNRPNDLHIVHPQRQQTLAAPGGCMQD